jgi:hypothetical protein
LFFTEGCQLCEDCYDAKKENDKARKRENTRTAVLELLHRDKDTNNDSTRGKKRENDIICEKTRRSEETIFALWFGRNEW